jgi:RNA-directed DNA polymerase
MKRQGQLMEKIADAENLRLAFWKAAKGKRGKADCLTFRERLDENLAPCVSAASSATLWGGGHRARTA